MAGLRCAQPTGSRPRGSEGEIGFWLAIAVAYATTVRLFLSSTRRSLRELAARCDLGMPAQFACNHEKDLERRAPGITTRGE